MGKRARRAYEELRQGIESLGGTMQHERAGWPRGGAWIVQLGDKEQTFLSNGKGFPELDQLYEPKVPKPTHYRDYTTTLIPRAIEKLVGKLSRPVDE